MKNIGLITLAALCCAPATLFIAACRDAGAQQTEAKEEPKVSVVPLQKQTVSDYGEWFGYLSGTMDTDIHARVGGFLVSQDYKNGQLVKKGDVLFRIEPDMYEAVLAQAKANLGAAEASLVSAQASKEQAELDVKRYELLVKSRAVSEKDLDDARQKLKAAIATEDAARATIEQMKAAQEKAQINLDYTVVQAPYDGIVGEALISQGALISPATKLANISAVNPLRVDFSINADSLVPHLNLIPSDKGEAIQIDALPFEIVLENGEIYPEKGRLIAVESKVSSSGLINLEGEIPNPDMELRAGMPVRVRIAKKTRTALLVPKEAVRTVLRGRFIIIMDKDNVPHTIPVSLEGEYPIDVEEENGYTSRQSLSAISGVGGKNLEEMLKRYGYENAEEVPVVADSQNGVYAMNISAANSRLSKGEQPAKLKTKAFTFRPAISPAVKKAVAKKDVDPQAKATMPLIPVKVTNLLQRDVEVTNDWFGSLRGIEETEIRPKVSGLLLSQNFSDGDMVKKGDVLFTIDPAPYQAALNEAKANLSAAIAAHEQAKATLSMSEKDLQRYRRLSLSSPGAVSDKVVTDAQTLVSTNEAAVQKAEATIAQMKAALRQAEINLSYTTVTAPFDGRAGIHKYSIGSLVSPDNNEPLVLLSSVNPMRVDFNVSGLAALEGLEIYNRQAMTGEHPSAPEFSIILSDEREFPEKGRVISADNSLSKSTGTLKIIGQVNNINNALRSGMPVRVRAAMKPIKGAFLVPARAPLNAKGMDLLALVAPDNAPILLPISKGNIVNIPVSAANGNIAVQPMQIVDVNRDVVSAMILAKANATSLEEMILKKEGAENWKALSLQQAKATSSRELAEKKAGQALPDDYPTQQGAGDWDGLLLKQEGVKNFRALVLKQAKANDELDLIAHGRGCQSLMEMALKELGFTDTNNVPVIAEGSLMAAQIYAANEAAGGRANKVRPVPFIYEAPRTVVSSVTAEQEKGQAAEPTEQDKQH